MVTETENAAPLNSSMADGTLKFSSIREVRSPKSYKIKSGSRKGKSLNQQTGSQNNQGNESTRRRPNPNDVGYFSQKGSQGVKTWTKDVAENRMYVGT